MSGCEKKDFNVKKLKRRRWKRTNSDSFFVPIRCFLVSYLDVRDSWACEMKERRFWSWIKMVKNTCWNRPRWQFVPDSTVKTPLNVRWQWTQNWFPWTCKRMVSIWGTVVLVALTCWTVGCSVHTKIVQANGMNLPCPQEWGGSVSPSWPEAQTDIGHRQEMQQVVRERKEDGEPCDWKGRQMHGVHTVQLIEWT